MVSHTTHHWKHFHLSGLREGAWYGTVRISVILKGRRSRKCRITTRTAPAVIRCGSTGRFSTVGVRHDVCQYGTADGNADL